jgi:hypothetical protein
MLLLEGAQTIGNGGQAVLVDPGMPANFYCRACRFQYSEYVSVTYGSLIERGRLPGNANRLYEVMAVRPLIVLH